MLLFAETRKLGKRTIPRLNNDFQIHFCSFIFQEFLFLHKRRKKQRDRKTFTNGPIAKSFWNKFTKWYNAICRGNIALEQNEIIYGVLKFTSSGRFNPKSSDHN